MIILNTLPLSINQLYRGRRFLTKEGKDNKLGIATEMKYGHGLKSPAIGPICLTVAFYMPNMRKDIDAGLKTLLDCGTGILWKDDKQIEELHVHKYRNKINPRTEIEILEL